ncbi:MAG: undecaprenyl/decaprenyl-phosphate alpha-N-acetylglucosaminyl 1-phosphate transferase [Candidatus Cloacimonetes bacterium]|nr:undecaprenyl/decaprenyl-phosphate alpha-N-acetylglucosaminyl 1-phosphate transferase [Candidatus Cloacimonadota bacterium]
MEVNIYHYFLLFGMSFVFVYAISPFIRKFAIKINFVDQPNARKVHKIPTSLLGGAAVFIGFFIMIVFESLINYHVFLDRNLIGFLAGATIIFVLGIIDDRMGMKPQIKMLGQIVSSLFFILSNYQRVELITMFGSEFITIPILLFWMVGLMNAFNFLDNMDGIITGMAGIIGLGFFGFTIINGGSYNEVMQFMGLVSLCFSGALFGFLPYNFNPAKMFLGDAGSMFIGYFLASMGIQMAQFASNTAQNKFYFLLPVLMLSYSIFDISLVSYTRKRDGRHIMQGGKDHSTHRMHTVLGSAKITAVFIYIINLLIIITSMIVFKIRSLPLMVASTIIFAVAFIIFGNKLDQVPIIVPENQKKK